MFQSTEELGVSGVVGGDIVTSSRSGPGQRVPSRAVALLPGHVGRRCSCCSCRSCGVGLPEGHPLPSPPRAAGSHLAALPVPWPPRSGPEAQLTSEDTVRSLWDLPASSSSPWLSILPRAAGAGCLRASPPLARLGSRSGDPWSVVPPLLPRPRPRPASASARWATSPLGLYLEL